MRLHFLGTRGGISARSSEHYMHSSLLISFRKTTILLDWGADWLSHKLPLVNGVLITHAHPDHIGGITQKFPYPIYATKDTWKIFKKTVKHPNTIQPRKPFTIGSLHIEPFAVHHSVHAPAVGYRITGGKRSLFYVSDLISIVDEKDALTHLDLYIGDGAITTRTLLSRTKNTIPVGHSPIIEQLSWCAHYKVPRAIFTHCGSEIVKGNPQNLNKQIKKLSKETNVKSRFAYDGMKITI